MSDYMKSFTELIEKNKKATDKLREEYLKNLDYYLEVRSRESEPCDLNGRDLYYGAGDK